MHGMENMPLIEVIKHLVMLIEDQRVEIKELKKEIGDLRTYIYNKEVMMPPACDEETKKRMEEILKNSEFRVSVDSRGNVVIPEFMGC